MVAKQEEEEEGPQEEEEEEEEEEVQCMKVEWRFRIRMARPPSPFHFTA